VLPLSQAELRTAVPLLLILRMVQFADGGGTVVQPGAPQPFRVPLWLFKSLYVWYTIHNAGRAGNRGKSKRRLKTTPVLG